MKVIFTSKDLEAIYHQEWYYSHKYPQGIIQKFIERVGFLKNMIDIRELYTIRSFNFEKLRWFWSDLYSIRLNKQWRLLFRINDVWTTTLISIEKISKHYE